MLLLKSFSFFLRFWSKTTEFLAQAIDLFCLRRKRIISANYPYNILCKELVGCVVVSFRRGDKEARKVETSSKNHGFLLWSRFLFLLYGWSKEQEAKRVDLTGQLFAIYLFLRQGLSLLALRGLSSRLERSPSLRLVCPSSRWWRGGRCWFFSRSTE